VRDRGALLGLLITAAVAATLPIQSGTAVPLAAFIVGPLVTSSLSGPWATASVGIVAVTTSAIEGQFVTELSSGSVLARCLVTLVGSAIGVAAARRRTLDRTMVRALASRQKLADALQSGLLPQAGAPEGTRAASWYVPGEARMMLGGDFFDTYALADGTLTFVIGDVSGHGPTAAALASSLRAGWRALAASAPATPLAWLETLERAFMLPVDAEDWQFATICTGLIEADRSRAHVVSAGHPWPILEQHGQMSYLALEPGRMLGVGSGPLWAVTTVELPPAWRLVLYTDGLTDSRVAPDAERLGEDGLLARLSRPSEMMVEARVASLIDDLTAREMRAVVADDIAVMVLGVDVGASVITRRRALSRRLARLLER
jgi:serine phosphatase RsbU (regulator of sigma subunit)